MAKKKNDKKSPLYFNTKDATEDQVNAVRSLMNNFTEIFDLSANPNLKKRLESSGGIPKSVQDVKLMFEIIQEQLPAIATAVDAMEDMKNNNPDEYKKFEEYESTFDVATKTFKFIDNK